MSLESFIGPEGNLLEIDKRHCQRLHVPMPVLTNEELAAIKHMDVKGWKTKTIDITFAQKNGEKGLVKALERICVEAESAIDEGYSLVVLSDRELPEARTFPFRRCSPAVQFIIT